MSNINPEDIDKVAAMFCHHVPPNKRTKDDMIFVKERVKLKDGTEVKRTRRMVNVEKPFWILKKQYRNYEDKREDESRDRLDMYWSTAGNLPNNAAKALGLYMPDADMRRINMSPYVYGTDVTPESYVMNMYREACPDYAPAYEVVSLDFEANMDSPDKELTIATVADETRGAIAITEDFAAGITEQEFHDGIMKLVGEELESYGVRIKVKIVKDDFELVRTTLGILHKWQPDYVSVWNLKYDAGKMKEACERRGVDPKWLFSDPSVPDKFKYFSFKEKELIKTTSTGKKTSKNIEELWHHVEAPASFTFTDSMATYWRLRQYKSKLPSYGLDFILKEESLEGKLTLEEASHLTGIEWHRQMSRHHKVAYVAYGLMDSVRLKRLDMKTKDLSHSIPSNIGVSPFREFSSGPRSLATDMHFYLLKKGRVIASTPPTFQTALDSLCPNMNGWIITLSSKNIIRKGYQLLYPEYGEVHSRLFTHVMDVDVTSGYPLAEVAGNVGKATRVREVYKIQGLSEPEQRRISVNMTGMSTNALNITQIVYGVPAESQILEDYKAYKTNLEVMKNG